MKAIPAYVMRGGTSKGLYFNADELPADTAARDAVLLAAMGSPDERQIDGMGGAHPLTSKVAIVSPSTRSDADVDYLFLQVVVDKAAVSDAQNCGNILAGVGPYAIEQGMVHPQGDVTDVRIHMVNTGALAVARVQTPAGQVAYEGDAGIDGVPGTAAPVMIDFLDVAGSSCGALFPTGNTIDTIDGITVTCVDNGMPVVMLHAASVGATGNETPAELEARADIKAKVEALRLQAGKLMNLGDVTHKTVPKMSLLSPARHGGAVNTHTFIPHRVHEAIGVLGSVSVATACVLPGTVASEYVSKPASNAPSSQTLTIEHPTGAFTVEMDISGTQSLDTFSVNRAALLRTARLLMRGEVLVPNHCLPASQ